MNVRTQFLKPVAGKVYQQGIQIPAGQFQCKCLSKTVCSPGYYTITVGWDRIHHQAKYTKKK